MTEPARATAGRPFAGIPLVGRTSEQFRRMRHDRLGALLDFNREQGDIGRFHFLFGDIVLANSPDLVHEVLVKQARHFEKSPIMRSALYPLAGQGLFTSEGELWRRQRRLMAPMFKHAALGDFAADMTGAAERAARTWQHGAVVDMARETTRITMAVAARTLFGTDTFDEADELGAALTTALDWTGEQSSSLTLILQARAHVGLELVADRLPPSLAVHARALAERVTVPILWPGRRTRELRAAIALLDGRVARLIAERRGATGERPRGSDLLDLLLSARSDEDGGAMSDRQVRDEVLTLFVAGHETTANALAWALMLLAEHPPVYAALRAELDALGRVPAFEDLPRLGLALRVFKEALRLYPPVYLFGRVATSDVTVAGALLPKGTVVLVSPFALHRRPELWPEPERFDPDRFLPEAEAARPKTAFIPFSAGPRTCIGNAFALMEGPLVLATLLHHADLALVDRGLPMRPEPEPHATLRPKGGLRMRVALRARADLERDRPTIAAARS